MEYVLFRNEGIIELEAFNLLGASTKREDANQIGFFGSGLKYALAFLLRENIEFHVFLGFKKIKIEKREVSLRNKRFQQVFINNKSTSITTDWGTLWKPWQIFRELGSNAYDEKGSIEIQSELKKVKNETRIYVKNEDFLYFARNLNKIFLVNHIHSNAHFVIPKKEASPVKLYKKGVRVNETTPGTKYSFFDYHTDFDLSEERLANNENWNLRWAMVGSNAIGFPIPWCKKVLELLDMQQSGKEMFEFVEYRILRDIATSPHLWEGQEHQKNWIAAAEELKVKLISKDMFDTKIISQEDVDSKYRLIVVNNTIFEIFQKWLLKDTKYVEAANGTLYKVIDREQNSRLYKDLDRALAILSDAEINIPYKIQIVSFFDASMLGLAESHTKTISIGLKAMEYEFVTLTTILEEYVHLYNGVEDCTRSMQTALLGLAAEMAQQISLIKTPKEENEKNNGLESLPF